MDNNKFLKKYKGSCELVGKEGPLAILNNLHTNIIGYKPIIIKKRKKVKNKEPDYSYVQSIVKDDFNQNINYNPQLNNLLIGGRLRNNNFMYINVVKSKGNNKNEENKNFLDNSNFNKDLIRKKNKSGTVNIKPKYINKLNNDNENTNQKKLYKSKSNLTNFNIDSKEILPLIKLRQQNKNQITPSKELNKKSKNKKIFTPILKRQNQRINRNNFSLNRINFNNEELLKRNKSTINIRSSNNNIFPNNIINNMNNDENYIYNYRYRDNYSENDNNMVNKILLKDEERKINVRKKIINDRINQINKNESGYLLNNKNILTYTNLNSLDNYYNNIKNQKYDFNTNEILVTKNKKNYNNFQDENNLYIINEVDEESNKKTINNIYNDMESSPNELEILMKQRQNYLEKRDFLTKFAYK
jgi:hypothetical protein